MQSSLVSPLIEEEPTVPNRLLFAALALALVPTLPLRGAESEPCPFGIASSGESFGDHPRLFPLLREAGVGMVRSFPEWGSFQPERGKWDWSHGDALVESARKSGIQIEAILCYLEGLEKVNQIKTRPGVVSREIEVAL